MPYANVPDDKQADMERCVLALISEGKEKDKAIAICYASVVEGRERETTRAAIAPHMAEAAVFAGREWEVTIIGSKGAETATIEGKEYVPSANGRLYSVSGLRESVPLWDGAKVYDNHLTDEEFQSRQGMRSIANEWVGTITAPRWDESARAIKAVLKIVDEGMARKLYNAHNAGVLSTIGLSIDSEPMMREATIEGRRVQIVEGIKNVHSVDVVAEPAAGGTFNRLIAAKINSTEDYQMDENALTELVKKTVAEALAANTPQTPEASSTPAAPAIKEAMCPGCGAQVAEGMAYCPGCGGKLAAEEQASPVAPEATAEAVRKLEARITLSERLGAAKLSDAQRRVIEAAFNGRVFNVRDLDNAINAAKQADAAQDTTGRVAEGTARAGRVSVGMNERDIAEVEFTRLLAGNTQFNGLYNFIGLADDHPHAYVRDRMTESHRAWIKAGRPKYGTRKLSEWAYHILGGDPFQDSRAYEAITTSGMATIVKNAVNLMLAADYSQRLEWWGPIVRKEVVDTIDTATLGRIYGLSTLSVVDEGNSYTEMTWADEEETATFVKKGNFVGITLETLLRDKLNVLRSLPERLANAWYNTKSAMAAAVFTTNTLAGPVLSDTGALFNATAATSAGGHANLLTTALSFAQFGVCRIAMRKQTDQVLGVGVKLLVDPKYILVPVDLETTALEIKNSEREPGGNNNEPNPYYQKVEVVVVPEWTDTADFALVADPARFPAIWDIALRGNEVPQIFTADSETSGAMFTNDTLRYKVRQMAFRFSATYDCLPVSDFRPLHKSNV